MNSFKYHVLLFSDEMLYGLILTINSFTIILVNERVLLFIRLLAINTEGGGQLCL